MVKSAGVEQSTGKRFKGVRMRSWGRWVSEIRLPKSRARLWLGSYSSPERAARAYDVALRCLRGASAALNFPDSPPAFAPLGLPHRHIQKLAAAASSSSSSSLSDTQSSPQQTPLSSSSSTTALSSPPSPLSSRASELSSPQPQLSSASPSSNEHSSQVCHPHHEQSALSFPFSSSAPHNPSLSSSCDATSSLEAEDLSPTELRDASSSPEANGLSPAELEQNSSEVSAESVFQVPKWDLFTSLLDGTLDNFSWLPDASEWQEITMYDSLVPMEKLEDDSGRIFDPYLWSS